MPNSIFKDFFSLCSAVILASVLCVGAVLIVVATGYYQSNAESDMKAAAQKGVTEIKLSYLEYGQLFHSMAYNRLDYISEITGTNFILADSTGEVIYTSIKDSENNVSKYPYDIIDKVRSADKDGYWGIGTLDRVYTKSYFNLGNYINLEGEDYYLFSIGETGAMKEYINSLIFYFILISLAITLIFLPIVHLSVKRLTNPIKEMTFAAKRFGEGNFSQKLAISEVNELGFLANTLNDMASSLSVIEETRKSFVSNVSHELKTPMTSIGGFIDGILDGTIPESHHRKYLKIVSEEVQRLARLVRSMLNIAKYETGEIEMKTEDFDVVPLVIKTVLLFERRIEEKNVEILGLDSGRFFINADIDLVQQVIYNLVENAVKFVNTEGYIKFSFSVDSGRTHISIRNSGEGLTGNELPRVFDRFYKTDESRGKDKTGVGLGLSIVRSIVKLHDGTITVKSAINEYVELVFTMKTVENPNKKK